MLLITSFMTHLLITIILGIATGVMAWRDWRLGLLLPTATFFAVFFVDSFILLPDAVLWLIYLVVTLAARSHRRSRAALLDGLSHSHKRNPKEIDRMDIHDLE